MSWYAAHVFHRRTAHIAAQMQAAGVRCFVPEVIGSLLFWNSDEDYARRLAQQQARHLHVYCRPGTNRHAVIPDSEMEMFLFVCTSGEQGLLYLGDDKPEYHQGDRVRVTEGPLKGAEGHIRRIRRDRRLVVTVSGVAAVATAYIHPKFLEVVTANTVHT